MIHNHRIICFPTPRWSCCISAAQENGADILATGHNLDDESIAIFMNYIRGDVEAPLSALF